MTIAELIEEIDVREEYVPARLTASAFPPSHRLSSFAYALGDFRLAEP